MKQKLPILIIIPHGGSKIPEELRGYEAISDSDLLMQADTYANELFAFDQNIQKKIDTQISRLFIDTDRKYKEIPPAATDGVIKKTTLNKKEIYKDDLFPDEIAISNILKRYYFPFHDSITETINSNNIKLIIECHTMMAIGPDISDDPGKPRPIVSVENQAITDDNTFQTCDNNLAESLIDNLKKSLSGEEETIVDNFERNRFINTGFILSKYGQGDIPMMRLSISRSLFINDKYFNYDYLRVDELRLAELKNKIWKAIKKFYNKNFD